MSVLRDSPRWIESERGQRDEQEADPWDHPQSAVWLRHLDSPPSTMRAASVALRTRLVPRPVAQTDMRTNENETVQFTTLQMDDARFSVFVGATIHTSPAEPPIIDGVVVVHGGKIAAVGRRGEVSIPSGSVVIDCGECTMTSGFWNSHVHFFERKWAKASEIDAGELARQLRESFGRFGFTNVFDLGSPWENTIALRDRIESGEVPGPRIRTTGEALVPPNAMPGNDVLRVMGVMPLWPEEIADRGQAVLASRRVLKRGADGVKVFVSGSQATALPSSVLAAVVDEARRFGKPVFVHPNSTADVLAAAQAGVDVIGHTTPTSGEWDEATLAAMAERRVALTPTLALWQFFLRHDRVSVQEHAVSSAVDQLRVWHKHGGTVFFGTDLGAVDADPAEEYRLMMMSGMSFADILASLTTVPAAKLGEPFRSGRIAVGVDADLVVFNGDPLRDIRALTNVRLTCRAGKIIYERSDGSGSLAV